MEIYRNFARVVAIQVMQGFQTTDGLPKWFAKLVKEEQAKVERQIEEIEKAVGLA